jgi:serine O-acetyltransferase
VLNNNAPGTLSWRQQLSGLQQAQFLDAWKPGSNHLPQEGVWQQIRAEAAQEADSEPLLASALHTNILAHKTLGKAMAHLLALKMSSRTLLGTQLMRLINDAYADEPSILEAAVADIQAVKERDPACESFVQCLLNFKGFQAIQCYRVGHWLWMQGRHTLAMALQSRVSEVLQVDIHPAARIGRGILMDHATGVVIGETAVVGDNVSMLHHVTLGGSGTGQGTRHPTIGNGALLGAGVSVLGPITVGAGCKVGAGSVVVQDLPDHCVAVGVPARVIKRQLAREPSKDMDQCTDFLLDYVI